MPSHKHSPKRPLSLRHLLLSSLPICLVLQAALALQSGAASPAPLKAFHRTASGADQPDLLESRKDELAAASNATTDLQQAADFVISSLEDEQQPSGDGRKLADERRHRYDQQQLASGELGAPTSSQPAEAFKRQIEPRNEPPTPTQQQDEQLQLADQIIIDHRPAPGAASEPQQSGPSSSQSPPVATPTSASASSGSTSAQQPQGGANLQAAASTMSLSYPQWTQAASPSGNQPQQQLGYGRQAQPSAGQQQFGGLMSGSNQMATAVQHPTSINSIISEQQAGGPQQQQQQQQQQLQLQAQAQQALNNQQQQQLLLVSPQGQQALAASALNQQLIGVAANGRRVSLSNWFRGLGSMLANIFNRREHAGLSGAQLQQAAGLAASGSSPAGHWIQLGPSAPHWLTQAQSAIQKFQQQHQQVVLPSARYAAFIPGPQQSAGTNMIAVAVPPPQQQQVAPGGIGSSTNGAYQQQQLGDLLASGSSLSYATIQTPVAASQPLQQQATLAGQTSPQALLVGQLQQQQQPFAGVAPTIQMQQQQHQPGQVASQPQQQQQQSSLTASRQGADQVKQALASASQQQSATIAAASGQARFGRSSKHQHQEAQPASAASQTTGGNLPLAHYSQYSAYD